MANLQQPARHERLGFKVLTSYGSIQLGINSVSTMALVHLLFFYTDVALLDAGVAGSVIALGHLWDAITDPMMGLYSDTRRGRAGRRRPFFIPGAIFMAIFFGMLFVPPAALEGRALFWWMVVTYIAFCTGRTILDVPFNAITPEITPHYDERSRLAGWRMGLSVFGDMMGGMVPIIALIALGDQRQAFTVTAALMAGVSIGCGVYGRWGTYETYQADPDAPGLRERLRQFAVQGADEHTGIAPTRSQLFVSGLRAAVNPVWSAPALLLISAQAMVIIGTGFPYTTFRYVSKYFFHNPDLDLLIMACYQFAGLLAAPVWIWVAHRINKKYAYQAAIFGYVFSTLPVLMCSYEDEALFLAAMAGCGIFGTGVWMVPNAIAPDVVDFHRLHKTNVNEGVFYGLWAFIQKFAGGVSPWIVGITLAAVDYQPNVVQDGRVLQTIMAMFVVYPLGLMGAGALIFTWYPITRQSYARIREQLDATPAENDQAG